MLCCRKRSQELCIEVRDNGSGIPEALQPVIFGEFERLHQGGKGLGLGLAIARGIAAVLHQPIELRSREHSGTTFSIRVPRRGQNREAAASKSGIQKHYEWYDGALH